MNDITINGLFNLSETIAAEYLRRYTYPYEALAGISDYITELGNSLSSDEYDHPEDNIWIHKTAVVAASASLNGPLIICRDAQIRHCAFIRGSAIVGEGAVVGNSTELKNVILFNKVQVPHYNYVGDSILGYKAHMGAGSITSNVKSDKLNVCIKDNEKTYETGRKKVGAMLGDNVEVGCNSVLNPGTIVCPGSNIYPCSMVRGVIPADSIYKSKAEITPKNI